MSDIIGSLLIIFLTYLLTFIVMATLHLIFMKLFSDFYERKRIEFCINTKKFKDKVNPIYKVVSTSEYSVSKMYFIEKWVVRKVEHGLSFFLLIIPYPISIVEYSYELEDSVQITSYHLITLEDIEREGPDVIYERINQPIIERYKLESEENLKIQEKLNKINKVFNENIE